MLELMDWFCGAGGSSQGAHSVPGVRVSRAANHWDKAIETHATNFPETDHYLGDIRTAPVHRWPTADLLWASPECPQWSTARGTRRDFHHSLQTDLLELPRDEEADRSRALMEEVPLYLRGAIDRGQRVRAGVVENVIEVRAWDQWERWVREIRALGYHSRLVALNSMHAQPARTPAAPQSRDRLYLAFWDTGLGRNPDWDKWLRPLTYCSQCQEWVSALQVFKRPGADMGRYRQQYLYRCPHISCRNSILEPPALPALTAIDWSLPGSRIGDRARPLAEKTMQRIQAGLQRYSLTVPLVVPAGGTWRDAAVPLTAAMSARTTRDDDALAVPAPFLALLRSDRPRTIGLHEPLATIVADGSNHALVVPPLIVPMEGRDGKEAVPATLPLRTQTTRAETALAFVPFIAELRGGNSETRPITHPLSAVTAGGNHHALLTPPTGTPPQLWTGFDSPTAVPVAETALAPSAVRACDIDDVRFRMLEPHEIGTAMAFTSNYVVIGTRRERVRQYGNAVTPPSSEVLISALVEAITGEDLERWPTAA
ncbi:DNA cytosine methyltransferase [Nocardia brasiliensis]